MIKKLLFTLVFIYAVTAIYAQDDTKCSCPTVKLYVYDTKMDFAIDNNSTDGVYIGKYLEAKSSGDWLEGAFVKQQSDEFKVYKNMRPDSKTGNTFEPSPSDGGSSDNGIDFTSSAEVSRSGDSANYTYSVTVKIYDAYTHDIVTSSTQTTSNLGNVDDLIDAFVGSFSPVLDHLRSYQKQLRDQSGGTKWIGLKWRTIPDNDYLKIHATTNVKIKVFDCYDQKPAADQELKIKQTNTNVGSLSVSSIKTNGSGEAQIVFTAKDNGYTRVFPDLTFTDVNDKSGKNATSCSDQKDITVADALFKIKMEAEITGPEGIHYQLSGECNATLVAYADSTYGLRPQDGTKNMAVTVSTAGVPGKMELVSPKKYNIPFTCNIGNIGKTFNKSAAAKFSIESFSPTANNGTQQPETYATPASTLTLPGNINSMFNGIFSKTVIDAAKESGEKAQEDLPFLQRLRAHKNDPSYFQTAQGKSDLLQLQKLSQETGHGLSNMYMNGSQQTPPPNATNGSTAFVKGIIATQTDSSMYKQAPNAYTPTVIGGMMHFEGSFNPTGGSSFQANNEATIGPLHGIVKITIEKLQ